MEVIVSRQWEYCAIVSVTPTDDGWLVGKPYDHPSRSKSISSIHHFIPTNQRVNFRPNDPKSLSKEISKLGTDGWELVSVDQGVMYFKRPM